MIQCCYWYFARVYPYFERQFSLSGIVMNTKTHYITTLLHPFNSLFSRTTPVSWYQNGKTSLGLTKAKDDGALGYCRISRIMCKQSAPRPAPDR